MRQPKIVPMLYAAPLRDLRLSLGECGVLDEERPIESQPHKVRDGFAIGQTLWHVLDQLSPRFAVGKALLYFPNGVIEHLTETERISDTENAEAICRDDVVFCTRDLRSTTRRTTGDGYSAAITGSRRRYSRPSESCFTRAAGRLLRLTIA